MPAQMNGAVVRFPTRPPVHTGYQAEPPPPPSPFEPLIAARVADAAGVLLCDMIAYDAGKRAPWMGGRDEGGKRIAALYELRQACMEAGGLSVPFEQIARVHGAAELMKRGEGRLSASLTGILIDGVLETLDNVTKHMSC